MNIFIADVINNQAVLTPEESWHCAKVLRRKAGDEVKLIDGKGLFFEARLIAVNEKKCVAEIIGEPIKQTLKNYYLHLIVAPTKNIDRVEWMVEKAVEIGVNEISFAICKNSERKVIKTDRMVKIVESAAKQSLQAFIPKVNDAENLSDLLKKITTDQKLVAHCFDSDKKELTELKFRNTSTAILIGPEGDFTMDEVNQASALGFVPVSLGQNRLRTETAGLYVCQAVSILSAVEVLK